MQKTVVNLSTGTVEIVDLTAEEQAEYEDLQPTTEQLIKMYISAIDAQLQLEIDLMKA